MAHHFFAIGGPSGTGKSFACLTAPKPLAVIYADRPGGDIDLEGLEAAGVHLYKVDLSRPRDSALARINEVRGDIAKKGLKTVIYDGLAFSQIAENSKVSGQNRNSMVSLQKKGAVSNNVADILDALLTLQGVHVGITFHIKEEPLKDGDKIVGTIWRPMLMPQVANVLQSACGLIGYTWKRAKASGTGNDYGTCFLEEVAGKTAKKRFACAKSPEGWGHSEPTNISAWFKRIEDDRDKARAAALNAADGKVVAPPPEEPDPAPSEPAEAKSEALEVPE